MGTLRIVILKNVAHLLSAPSADTTRIFICNYCCPSTVEKHTKIPMNIKDEDDNIVSDKKLVVAILAADFSTLYNPSSNVDTVPDVPNTSDHGLPCLSLNRTIKKAEVDRAIAGAKKGKATGVDELHVEVLSNNLTSEFLQSLFHVCCSNGPIQIHWTHSPIGVLPLLQVCINCSVVCYSVA